MLSESYPYHSDSTENAYCFAKEVHKDQVSVAFGERDIPKLSALLTEDTLSSENRVEALETLLSLLSNQERKCIAVAHGVVPSCSSLLGAEVAAVRAGAAHVLAALVLVVRGRSQSRDAIVPLTVLLEDASADARIAASLAIKNLALFQDGCALMTSTENTVRRLVYAALDQANPDATPTAEVTLNLVCALADITRYTTGRAQALQAGCIEQLLAAVELGTPGLLGRCVVAVWNLAQSADGKALAIKGGAVAAVAVGLSDVDAEVRRCAAGALRSLAVDELGKSAIQEADGAISGLARALKDTNEDVRQNAAAAIRTASENPFVLRTFVEVLVPETRLLEMVYSGTQCAARPCVELLESKSAEQRCDAARAISLMAHSERGCDAVEGGLYAVERLAALTMEANGDTVKHACDALLSICRSSRGARRRLRAFASEPGNETARKTLAAFSELADLLA